MDRETAARGNETASDPAGFFTRADARLILAANPEWEKRLRGDLQMHTVWSDGSANIAAMAEAARGAVINTSRSPIIRKV